MPILMSFTNNGAPTDVHISIAGNSGNEFVLGNDLTGKNLGFAKKPGRSAGLSLAIDCPEPAGFGKLFLIYEEYTDIPASEKRFRLSGRGRAVKTKRKLVIDYSNGPRGEILHRFGPKVEGVVFLDAIPY